MKRRFATSRAARRGQRAAAELFFEDLVKGASEAPASSGGGVFEPPAGAAERGRADLFFADLTGEPLPVEISSPFEAEPGFFVEAPPEGASEAETAFVAEARDETAFEAEPTFPTEAGPPPEGAFDSEGAFDVGIGAEQVGPSSPMATVRWAQQALNQVTQSNLLTDGILGPQTAAALARYQEQRGLPLERRLLGRTLRALAGDSGTVPAGIWPSAPSHRGQGPDLAAPWPSPPTVLDGFPFGTATLTAAHRAEIERIAAEIAGSQTYGNPVHLVQLEGHTDDVGDDASNELLGQRRADAVAAELARALDRSSPGLSRRVGIWAVTAGETQPVAPNDTPDDRARNRRVEVLQNRSWKGATEAGTLTLTILDDRKEPAPAGTPYRLRVGAQVREGRLGEPGRLVETALALADVDEVFVEYGQKTEWLYGTPEGRRTAEAPRAAAREDTSGEAQGEITRWEIFTPVDDAAMKTEASTDIDPLTLPPVTPSWLMDGTAWINKNDPGHFIARKMFRVPHASLQFDTRVYFCHPIDHRFYQYPAQAMPPAAAQPASGGNLARSAAVPVTPTPAQPASKTGTVGGTPWYNEKPGPNVPLMGRTSPATTSDKTFQKLLTAVNKRLARAWMGELKRNLGEKGDLPKLVAWFGDQAGREHFKQWCQALGTQGGDRKSKTSAHGKGRALDMNYDHNPWVPLCHADGSVMVGEDHSRNKGGVANYIAHFGDPATVYAACGRIYDRALRLFVPLVVSDTDRNGARHFSSRYYRNHHDWTPTRTDAAQAPFTADQVFNFYQMLSWSVRFYFDYAFQQCGVPRTDANVWTTHTPPSPDPLAVWKRIEKDWTDEILPRSAEIHVTDPKTIPKSASALFDSVSMTYTYQSAAVTVSRFKLEDRMKDVTTDDKRKEMGDIVIKQLVTDHEMLSRGMVTTAPGRRDPCNGVFNHGYEVFLAFCYMLKDPDTRWLRAFGAFAAGAAGDMQHFDYRHAQR